VFLAQLQNGSFLIVGDGSFPPKPGIPTITSRNFTSISLKWDPVLNTSGAVVYLIEMTFTGEESKVSYKYLSEVYVSSRATVKFELPCANTTWSEYKDIFFRFKIAVLTGNSSVSYGPQTSQITLTKPDSVTNVTLDSLVYDSASIADKIKLTVSWNPPKDQKDLISHYGAHFSADSSCQYESLPRAEDSNGIYSIVGCSVSYPTVFNYTYPGCQNITNFPTSECYKFDPPYAPLKDRMVSNVKIEGNMTGQQDYRFTANVTWNPPVYPYKTPFQYDVKWSKEDSLEQTGFEFATINRHTITNLLPATSYKVEIKPTFPDDKPFSVWTSIILTTPGCLNIPDFPASECYQSHPPDTPLEDRMVSNVTLEEPMTAQQDYRFTVIVTWKPPVYPYITPFMYLVKWSKEDKLNLSHSADVNRQKITNLLPGRSYKLKVIDFPSWT